MASKRFTDIQKWDDKWFMELPPGMKLAWLYIVDCCDASGVIDLNRTLADFQIGMHIDWEDFLARCGERVHVLTNGKWFITRFAEFQYKKLSKKSKVHQSVLQTAAKNGVMPFFESVMAGENPKAIDSLEQGLAKAIDSLGQGYPKAIDSLKEKEKEKDKDKEKEEDKDLASSAGAAQLDSQAKLPKEIRATFERWCHWRSLRIGRPMDAITADTIAMSFAQQIAEHGIEHVEKRVQVSIERDCKHNTPYWHEYGADAETGEDKRKREAKERRERVKAEREAKERMEAAEESRREAAPHKPPRQRSGGLKHASGSSLDGPADSAFNDKLNQLLDKEG